MKRQAISEITLLLFTIGLAWGVVLSGSPLAHEALMLVWAVLALLALVTLYPSMIDLCVALQRKRGARPSNLAPLACYFLAHAVVLLGFIYAGWTWAAVLELIYGSGDCYYQRYLRVRLTLHEALYGQFSKARRG